MGIERLLYYPERDLYYFEFRSRSQFHRELVLKTRVEEWKEALSTDIPLTKPKGE